MQLLHSRWAILIKACAAGVVFSMTVYVMFVIGPRAETQYFPVLEKLQIIDIAPISDTASRVTTAFKKVRDCEYESIAWYRAYGDMDQVLERVSLVLLRDANDTSSANRPLGYQKSGPWQVGMPAKDIRGGSFVWVYHRCHPFWMTRTQFYP